MDTFDRAGDSKSRNIRLFVSSTFADMKEEREVLVKQVFPALQNLCKKRGVTLSFVDLRWGITSEQTNDGNTVQICLSEIDRCRPYFICMLGGRYGWAQPLNKSEDPLLKRTLTKALHSHPWLSAFLDRSVTELEVRHAVLNDPHSVTARNALFFMKQNVYVFLFRLQISPLKC